MTLAGSVLTDWILCVCVLAGYQHGWLSHFTLHWTDSHHLQSLSRFWAAGLSDNTGVYGGALNQQLTQQNLSAQAPSLHGKSDMQIWGSQCLRAGPCAPHCQHSSLVLLVLPFNNKSSWMLWSQTSLFSTLCSKDPSKQGPVVNWWDCFLPEHCDIFRFCWLKATTEFIFTVPFQTLLLSLGFCLHMGPWPVGYAHNTEVIMLIHTYFYCKQQSKGMHSLTHTRALHLCSRNACDALWWTTRGLTPGVLGKQQEDLDGRTDSWKTFILHSAQRFDRNTQLRSQMVRLEHQNTDLDHRQTKVQTLRTGSLGCFSILFADFD